MAELPNLLRQRLAATQTGENQAHPDADTLTAYMEQSLPAAESKTVVAHLAVCEPCREVVALSRAVMVQPAIQTVLTPAPVARWRRLFTPVFGAAAAVAAMAVIAVMVLQLPQKNSPQSSSATTNNATNHPENVPASQPAQETQQAKANVGDQAAPVESKAAASAPKEEADARLSSARSNLAASADLASAKDKEARLENSAGARAAKKPGAEISMASAPAVLPTKTSALSRKDYVNTNFFDSSSSDRVALDSQGNNLPAAPQPQLGATNSGFS
ncbi:MAG TPA: zf-HC2 domain-containing protein, partial [Candidatus Angelobacter sp.]